MQTKSLSVTVARGQKFLKGPDKTFDKSPLTLSKADPGSAAQSCRTVAVCCVTDLICLLVNHCIHSLGHSLLNVSGIENSGLAGYGMIL